MSHGKWGIRNIRSKKSFRKRLRKTLTPAEAALWRRLQGRQLLGKKFRRQHSVGRYIVDFYCPECRVAIELDGAGHFSITIDEYEMSGLDISRSLASPLFDLKIAICWRISRAFSRKLKKRCEVLGDL
jgi:very-short-patch-repair endonuclease